MHRALAHHQLPVLACAVGMTLLVASPALADAELVRAEGPLTAYSPDVPAGARARVQAEYTGSGASIVTLHVRGLRPNMEYGAHAHTNPCGAADADAGPHFQYVVDPVSPSTEPAYANSQNEIWLDVTTDDAGNAVAQTRVEWQFPAERRANSVVIHAEHTHTGPTDSGVAGPRLACLTVGF